jgi:hypothetical protein
VNSKIKTPFGSQIVLELHEIAGIDDAIQTIPAIHRFFTNPPPLSPAEMADCPGFERISNVPRTFHPATSRWPSALATVATAWLCAKVAGAAKAIFARRNECSPQPSKNRGFCMFFRHPRGNSFIGVGVAASH